MREIFPTLEVVVGEEVGRGFGWVLWYMYNIIIIISNDNCVWGVSRDKLRLGQLVVVRVGEIHSGMLTENHDAESEA